ncbi:gluconate 2-dehydrogenase subunit 3 family protein [Alteromonas sp. CI.11.F.A3]|uniref:gluconate 2-dehydrogenase subunit 3 family protein n=1 Tax=Alteromonas sp. CI.11.F.A3 TaxID=3079555 RepID=UPI002941C0C4|nr:gluconate 2-dehydrogenase subunit 3 family protein [Alteromonas sp. CI.11.F.A3]WOI37244.1 gluconate 2-dehydrogenase subunit 3 family protein [Alteromonas sp. CI.11.F.A3]
MERRDLLKLIATATGTALVGGKAFAYDIVAPVPLMETGFSKEDVALINEMAEVIIPQTDTPGAKAANVGTVIPVIVADCYTPKLQKAFKEGMKTINARSHATFQKDFLLLSSTQRETLFSTLDTEAKAANLAEGISNGIPTAKPSQWEPGNEGPIPHYFTLLKQLTLYTFFTSKVGSTKVLRYVAIPGYYNGELPYKKGDKAWAT